MSTFPKPDPSKLPALPGGGRPHVPQPGQFVPAGPAPQASRPTSEVTGPPVAARVQPGPPRVVGYVDPVLFAEGFFSSRADYDQTVRLAAEKIRSGQLEPREPDLDKGEKL